MNTSSAADIVRQCVCAAVLVLCSSAMHAQVDPTRLFSPGAAGATLTNFYFAQPNELTIVVNIMGFVQRPGRYEISASIDLVNLVSLAGGPTADGSLSDVKIRRMARKGDETWYVEFEVDLEDVVSINREAQATQNASLILSPGDLIVVGRSTWATVREVFGVVVSVALVTTAVTQIVNLVSSP